jgi:hypothetical protein
MKYRIWDKVNKKYLPKNTRYYVAQDGNVIVEDRGGFATTINQDNYTVELSTGLLDAKGVEIYDGDTVKIIEDYEETICNIKWFGDEAYPAFDVDDNELAINCGGNYLSYAWANDVNIEIIGTIHDTPREGE